MVETEKEKLERLTKENIELQKQLGIKRGKGVVKEENGKIVKELVEETDEILEEANRQLKVGSEREAKLLEEFKQITQMLSNKIEIIDRLNTILKERDKDKGLLTQENSKLKKIIKENGLEIGN